jgi:hypothetical protein
MSDEIPSDIVAWVIGGFSTLSLAVSAFLMKRVVARLDDDLDAHEERLNAHDKQHNHCTLELANFKTEVAKDYAKDASVQQSLARIHERIDLVDSNVGKGFSELREDIKKLIGMVK